MGEDGSQKFRSSKPHDPVRPSCSISTFSCLLAHILVKSSCLYLCPLPLPLPSFYMLIPNRGDPYVQHVHTISVYHVSLLRRYLRCSNDSTILHFFSCPAVLHHTSI